MPKHPLLSVVKHVFIIIIIIIHSHIRIYIYIYTWIGEGQGKMKNDIYNCHFLLTELKAISFLLALFILTHLEIR